MALHAGGLGALLLGGGLVDQADGAQPLVGLVRQGGGDMTLEGVAGLSERPVVVLEELLQSADGHAGFQGDGLAGLALQVGEQAVAVDLQQVKGLGVVAAEEELLQIVGKGRPQGRDLFRRHGNLQVNSP